MDPRRDGGLDATRLDQLGRETGVEVAPVKGQALFIYFSIASQFFLNTENLINILQNVSVVGIIACPATLLLISGQFDLSVGSLAGFTAMAMAT